MERYIDASKIKLTGLTFEDINNEVYFSLSDVRKAIEQTPTADVVEEATVNAVKEFAEIIVEDYPEMEYYLDKLVKEFTEGEQK